MPVEGEVLAWMLMIGTWMDHDDCCVEHLGVNTDAVGVVGVVGAVGVVDVE